MTGVDRRARKRGQRLQTPRTDHIHKRRARPAWQRGAGTPTEFRCLHSLVQMGDPQVVRPKVRVPVWSAPRRSTFLACASRPYQS